MPCSVHDLYMPYMYKGQVERLNLFTENNGGNGLPGKK